MTLILASLPARASPVRAGPGWVRGHIWFGLLSLPLILLHAGFASGGPLTSVLVALLVIVVVSGLFGVWLHRRVPRRMLRDAPMEIAFARIDRARVQLLDEADAVVASRCDTPDAGARLDVAGFPANSAGTGGDPSLPEATEEDALGRLRESYREMRPFLEHPRRSHALADTARARRHFERLRADAPATLHEALGELETICAEQRELLALSRVQGLVHGWLLIHVPFSFALLALALVHIVVALKYVTWRL